MAEYIKLYRSIRYTPMYKDAFFFKFWILCMFETETEPRDTHTLDGLITIQPGQFMVDAQRWPEKYNHGAKAQYRITWRRMWHYLKIMRDHGYITIDTHNHGRETFHIITVVDWERFYKIDPGE